MAGKHVKKVPNRPLQALALSTALSFGALSLACTVPTSAFGAPAPSSSKANAYKLDNGKYKVSIKLSPALAGKSVAIKTTKVVKGKTVTVVLGYVKVSATGFGTLITSKKISTGSSLVVSSNGKNLVSKPVTSLPVVAAPVAPTPITPTPVVPVVPAPPGGGVSSTPAPVPAKSLAYSATTFEEAAANDGSITATSTISLTNETFTGGAGASLGAVTNVPAGLTASLVKATSTTATLSFTGAATAHANAQDVSNLTVTFRDSDFTGGSASAVTGATKNNLVINFADPAPVVLSLAYSATTFDEVAENDGSITATSTITLTNDTFTGDVGESLGAVTNVPAGLTARLLKASSSTATLSFTGSATAHANAQDVSNLTVTFRDSDFTGGSASAVTGATKNNLVINFADPAPANAAPVITSAEAPISVDTGTAAGIYTVTATDDDADAITFALTGDDAASFDLTDGVVTLAAGVLAGTYNLQIQASDGTDQDSITIVVTVTDPAPANAAPVITSAEAPISVDTGTAAGIYTVTATDDDADAITFALTGDDAASFDLTDGVVTLAAGVLAGTYNLQIQASDGTDQDSITIVVTVTDPE